MTTFFLSDASTGFAAAFDEVDADVMRVEIRRLVDGDGVAFDVEYLDRVEARTMWSEAMKRGATREAGWPLWCDLHIEEHERCVDPEWHDGEECNCSALRAAGWTYCNEYTPGGAGWRRITPEN